MKRPLLAALLVLAALALAACGESEPKLEARGNPADPTGTEGAYLELEPLTYQIQISRLLNPRDSEDVSYLQGVPLSQRALRRNETWFGVFLRVANEGSEPAQSARRFAIVDTQRAVYRPVPIGLTNSFSYKPRVLQPGRLIPDPDSVAGQGVIGGTLVLFKLRFSTLQNRPLVFAITAPNGRRATVDLDV